MIKFFGLFVLISTSICAFFYACFCWISDIINQPYIYLLIGGIILIKSIYKLINTFIRYKALKNFDVYKTTNN
jgi:hypothetical protein